MSYNITSFFSSNRKTSDTTKPKTPDSIIVHAKMTPLMMATEAMLSNIEAELKNTKNNRLV